jgi:medium-chain acyl-[acyl-carrier-protein] hydrolase
MAVAAPRVRLLCFPHGGGSGSIFRGWPKGLPKDIEVWALQLPGRGSRMLERPPVGIGEIVTAVMEAFYPYRETPVALFGHSFGAFIAFEFARRLVAMNICPAHLFVSGQFAPHLPDAEPPICHLADTEFIAEVCKRYDGMPGEIIRNAEMIKLLLPVLRADFNMHETYRYVENGLLNCPISAFGGDQDASVTVGGLSAWRERTSCAFKLRILPGGHFFIETAREALLRIVADDIDESLCEPLRRPVG